MVVVIINTDTKDIKALKKDSEKGSMMLLSVDQNTMVLSCSAPDQPWHILVGERGAEMTWMYPDGEPETLAWLDWSVVTHTPTADRVNPKYASLNYESILCLPKNISKENLPPLILFSHG